MSCGGGGSLGVSGRELLTLIAGLSEDWALLLIEPLRDMYGELDPLASTHSPSSSGPSLPRSK